MTAALTEPQRLGLVRWLAQAQLLGLAGPANAATHIDNAVRFATAILHPPAAGEGRAEDGLRPEPFAVLDLGSGSGMLGLALAMMLPNANVTLLDAKERSVDAMGVAISDLGLGHQIGVLAGRAELVGRDPAFRERFDVVVARAFGKPAITVECGSPLVAVGGYLLVSTAPSPDPVGWALADHPDLGLAPLAAFEPGIVRLTKVASVHDRFPRAVGIPAKRPLW